MTSLKQLTLFVILWATGAASTGHGDPANVSADKRIVILGDSITAAYGLPPADAYPALLQKRLDQAGLPFQIINAGVSGDTTAGGLRRIDWALSGGAGILIIALGGNDGLRGTAPKQTAQNLHAIIQAARKKSPKLRILIAGMRMPDNMGEAFVKEFAELYPRVASEESTEFIPFLLEGVGGLHEFNQPDMIHPNAAGHARVAMNVWRVLEKTLKTAAQ